MDIDGSGKDAMKTKMMRGMLCGMASMMKDMSADREGGAGCCGMIGAGEGSEQLADLAEKCHPFLEKMKALFED